MSAPWSLNLGWKASLSADKSWKQRESHHLRTAQPYLSLSGILFIKHKLNQISILEAARETPDESWMNLGRSDRDKSWKNTERGTNIRKKLCITLSFINRSRCKDWWYLAKSSVFFVSLWNLFLSKFSSRLNSQDCKPTSQLFNLISVQSQQGDKSFWEQRKQRWS